MPAGAIASERQIQFEARSLAVRRGRPDRVAAVLRRNEIQHGLERRTARFRDAGRLRQRVRRADLRVEAAGRSGDRVGGNRAGVIRIVFAELRGVFLQTIGQRRVGGPEVRAAGVRRIIRILRGPRMKILRLREILADDFRADDLAVALDQAAVGLLVKQQSGRVRSPPADTGCR